MKKNKEQKKGQESTIGKIIYGFLLFMPLLAIGFTCLYAVFNKNAYKSYYGETINSYEYNEISNNNDFKRDKEYFVTTSNLSRTQYSNIYLTNFKLLNSVGVSDTNINLLNLNNIYRLNWSTTGNISVYSLDNNTSSWLLALDPSTMAIEFNCKLTLLEGDGYKQVYNIVYNKNSFVSEVFYYSVDRVTESSLFNWAQNSVIYTTTSATCNALSITTPFIPLLMSYWLIISVIYFLYDIALILVWLIHKKIHQLQESF